ncbi:uncharacterized protein [Apostichopus japonicus]|uniref:uncharacterized protein n=1 Tax=Stichopus japonicus TaxID=307972 RepID=UPI003AB26813
MAAKVVKDLSEDFLICCICMKQFRSPKMLPCIHSFCEECIEKYAAKQPGDEVPCPTCRQVCSLPETGVKGLQTNFHLINLVERVNLLERLTNTEESASVCDSCKSFDAEAFCIDCNFAICSKCRGHHALFPLLQSHSVIPVKELNDPKSQQEWKNARSPFCTLHPSEKLRFYCKTCSKLICRDCTIVLHSKPQHECTEATSQFDDSKQELNSLLENSVPQLEKAVGYKNDGNVSVVALNKSKEEIEIEITNHCNEMIREIRKVYDKQKQDLLEEITARIEPVESRVQSAEDWIKRMQTTQEITRKIISENNPWEVMAMSLELSNAFEALEEDSTAFKWSKSELQHEIAFSPGELPDIEIGFHYAKGDVVASDKQGNFWLFTFEDNTKFLHISKVMKISGEIVQSKPYKWIHKIPVGAKLVATVESNKCLLVGLGKIVVEFTYTSMEYKSHFDVSGNVNLITFIGLSGSLLFITSLNVDDHGNKDCKAKSVKYHREPSYSQFSRVRNYLFTTEAAVNSVFVCSKDIFFYTEDDELQTYSTYYEKLGKSYDVDPPNTLHITDVQILHCVFLGSHQTFLSKQDNANVFILWLGTSIKDCENIGEETWILKEYNTKDSKVLGFVCFENGKAPKPPSALQCEQTEEGGMTIHLCDSFGKISSYERGACDEDAIPYEIV